MILYFGPFNLIGFYNGPFINVFWFFIDNSSMLPLLMLSIFALSMYFVVVYLFCAKLSSENME